MLFPTTIVGSYPQPDWLIDREARRPLSTAGARARAVARGARASATSHGGRALLAIPRAGAGGLDIITDGEIRRELLNRIATALGASTSTTPAPRWTARAATQCRASSARSAARPSRWRTCCSSRSTPRAR